MARLILTDGDSINIIEVEKILRIGRHPDNELPINETMVSRHHAEIRNDGDSHRIIDLESLNGTWVNGKRVKEWRLRNGDTVQIGGTTFTWEDDFGTGASQTSSPFGEKDVVKPVKEVGSAAPFVPSGMITPPTPTGADPGLLRLLLYISRLINTSDDSNAFLDKSLNATLDFLNADRGAIVIEDRSMLTPVARAARRGELTGDIPVINSVIGEVMDKGVGVLVADTRNDARFGSPAKMNRNEVRSAICVPLWEGDSSSGMLYLDRVESDERFYEKQLDMAVSVASQLAMGLRHFRSIEICERKAVLRRHFSRHHGPDEVAWLMSLDDEARRIEIAPREIEATVMFISVADFTTVAEKLDATETSALLRNLYSEVKTAVLEYSGIVGKYFGGSLIALWPAESEAGPGAVNAALCSAHILRSLYKTLWKNEAGKWFKLRMGLHTGKVVAGHVVSDELIEYVLVGRAVNVAAGIQSAARANQVLASESTARMLDETAAFIDLGAMEFGGGAPPVRIFQLDWKKLA